MRWQNKQGSSNVDDRRGGGRTRKVGAGIGIGAIIMVVIGLLMGQDPMQLIQQLQTSNPQSSVEQAPSEPQDEMGQFVSVTLKYTEDVWTKLFREELNREYAEPTLVLFSGQDRSACGYASAATGPFYCPADQDIYIDLSFFQELRDRFGASGDFAMAYVIAHEVGHHVQNQLGISGKVSRQKRQVSKAEANELSVRLELQADFLAGVWAHHAEKMERILEEGDIEEALNAAEAIGDDRIQMRTQGFVVPESFTHGSSEQRRRWFRKGFETGDLSQGDTFSAGAL